MANEAFELAVRLRGEGIDDVEGDLEEMEGQFDETASSVDDSAADMEGFAQKWRGAMGAITAGLGLAAGTLLSRVPVVGEAMAGLESVIDAMAFKLDETLRPSIGDVSDELFDLSEDIHDADSAAEGFLDTLGTLDEIERILVEASVDFVIDTALDLSAEDVTKAVKGLVVQSFRNLTFATLHETLGEKIHNAIEQAIRNSDAETLGGAIVGLLKRGVREASYQAIGFLFGDRVEQVVRDVDWLRLGRIVIADIISGTKEKAKDLAATALLRAISIKQKFDDIDWLQLGKDIVNDIIDGLKARLEALKRVAGQLASIVKDNLPSSRAKMGPFSKASPKEIGEGISTDLSRGIQQQLPRVRSAGDSLASDARPDDTPAFAAGSDEPPAVYLDGRRINDNQGRYHSGNVDLRGR